MRTGPGMNEGWAFGSNGKGIAADEQGRAVRGRWTA